MVVLNLALSVKKILLLVALTLIAIRFFHGPNKVEASQSATPRATAPSAKLQLQKEGEHFYYVSQK